MNKRVLEFKDTITSDIYRIVAYPNRPYSPISADIIPDKYKLSINTDDSWNGYAFAYKNSTVNKIVCFICFPNILTLIDMFTFEPYGKLVNANTGMSYTRQLPDSIKTWCEYKVWNGKIEPLPNNWLDQFLITFDDEVGLKLEITMAPSSMLPYMMIIESIDIIGCIVIWYRKN